MFIRQKKIDRFIEYFPDQFATSFRCYLKKYEKGEATEEEVVGALTDQIVAACNTIKGLQR